MEMNKLNNLEDLCVQDNGFKLFQQPIADVSTPVCGIRYIKTDIINCKYRSNPIGQSEYCFCEYDKISKDELRNYNDNKSAK